MLAGLPLRSTSRAERILSRLQSCDRRVRILGLASSRSGPKPTFSFTSLRCGAVRRTGHSLQSLKPSGDG
jgi:hypothetical protein